MYWLFQGNEFFWARNAFSPAVDFWKHSLWRPTFLSLCLCSSLSTKLCYSEVTILIHCPIVPLLQTKVMAEDITASSKADMLCSCQCTHWTEHCSCSVLQCHFHFFWKITYWFYFLPRKKNSEHSKIVTREQNDNFCPYWMQFFFLLFEK